MHSEASQLHKWSSDSKAIILLQPSSAAAERVFSLLANSFKNMQTRALEDYIETSIAKLNATIQGKKTLWINENHWE